MAPKRDSGGAGSYTEREGGRGSEHQSEEMKRDRARANEGDRERRRIDRLKRGEAEREEWGCPP